MTAICARCGASLADDARFCSSCGAPVAGAQDAERKLATMLFADLVGSTELAAGVDPEDIRRRLAPFFDLARGVIEEHGGTVEKYIGDAIMAVFGVPRAHGDDPDRAVAAALALLGRVRSSADGLGVRIGVETGEVLAVTSGGDLSVTGDAVNAAARLQAAAAENEVLVGQRTAESCRVARLDPRGPIDAKGFGGRLRAWRASGEEATTPTVETPFMGRDEDLELLRLVYRRAVRERVPELVTVTGDAGIGKTRLASELIASLGDDEPAPQVLVGRNPPYGRGIAFWALAEIIRAAAGAGPDDSLAEVREALARRLEGLGAEDSAELAAALVAALGGADQDADVEDELRRAWRRLVSLLATERPLVIGLDDAHWADEGLLELIEDTAFRLGDSPVLLLCTARPELLEQRPDFGRAARNVTQIQLRPLAPSVAAQLAATLIPRSSEDLVRRVADASGGNPFFTEEVACAVREENDGIRAGRLPDTVQAAIAARLDLLPAAEKRVLQHAAVLGQGFTEAQLDDALGEPSGQALAALAGKALITERLPSEPGRWTFRHQLIRDVAYSSLPRAERAHLHEQAADAIAAHGGERQGELAELVAYHRAQAAELDPSPGRSANALRSTLEAAEAVHSRGATTRAQELYEQAASLADAPRDRIAALRAAADVAAGRFRGDEALRLLRAVARIGDETGDAASVAAAYALAVEVACRMSGITGDVPEVELTAMLQRGQELSQEADPVTRARLVLDEAWVAWRFDRADGIEGPARKALAMARELGDVRLLSAALDCMSTVAWNTNQYASAVDSNRERLELLAQQPRHSRVIESERSDALHMMVESLLQVARFREAREYAARARESDLRRGVVYSGWSRGLLPAFLLGQWDEVLEMARVVREAWTAMDRPPSQFLGAAVATAGAVLGFRGSEREYADWIGFAEDMAAAGGQALGVRTLKAQVELHRGRPDQARRLLLEPGTLFWWRATYLSTFAEALVRSEDPGARSALAEAEQAAGENHYAAALANRARGLLEGDEALLRRALATFHDIECPYQEAFTGWLLGGDERRNAQRTLERLGATAPAD